MNEVIKYKGPPKKTPPGKAGNLQSRNLQINAKFCAVESEVGISNFFFHLLSLLISGRRMESSCC